MSDYFSLPARGGGTSVAGTPGEDGANSERSSQYFMDVGNGAESIQTSLGSPPATHADHILPKDDPKSPYHVDVPVPSGMTLDTSGGPSDDHDSKYVREYPTDILVDRFKKWRKILKGIAAYLREVAFAQEQFARINFQLKGSVKFPFLTDLEEGTNKIIDPFDRRGAVKRQQPMTLAQQREQQQLQQQQEMLQQLQQQQQQQENFGKPQRDVSEDHGVDDDFQAVRTDCDTAAPSGFLTFGSGSIQDIQVVLKKYHLSLAAQQLKTSKEITHNLLPRIEDLRKDLHLKIKEIKELSGDFKTNINEHVAITGQLLNRYIASIKYMTTSTAEGDHIKLQKKGTQLKPKHDPYLLKLQLDLQLKRQLLEENYLQEAYVNLQNSGMELEKIVYGKIQQFLQKYSALMDAEAKLMIKNLCRELQQGILSKPPAFEWDKFVGHHPACLLNWKSTDPYPPSRKLSDVIYPQMKSPMAKCVRAGYLAKKSKYLKNYNKGYFVLTSNYLHEFKSSNFFNATVASTPDPKSGQSTSLSVTQAAKASLVPLMSIPLNDCILTEASDEKFVLIGKPTFNAIETRKVTPTASSASIHASHLNDAPAQLTKHTKHTIGKLLKGGKNKISPAPPAPKKPEENDEMMTLYTATQQEPNKTISWSFKPPSTNTTEDDMKQFRKWGHDLKNLTSFHNAKDRSKFIEDRMIKANYRNSRNQLKHTNSTLSMVTGDNFLRNDLSSMRSSRPQHIQLNNTATAPDLSVYRSKCNTPAVDDNGNLITVGEKRNLPSNTSMSPPLASPRYSEHSESSPSINMMNQQPTFPSAGMTITSKGISPSATVLNASPVASPNQRSVSQPANASGTTPTSGASATSARSGNSGGSGGGYFAIPVRNQGDTSQGSTPSYVEASESATQPPLPRTASYTAVARHYGGAPSQPSAVQRSINAASPLPKVRLNDQEIDQTASTQNIMQSGDSSEFPGLRKHASAGDIPTVSSESAIDAGVASRPYLTKNNGSQTSLNTVSPRTHAIRKHKKNVSFSSLNSLMFSKKNANNANSSGGQAADQFMSGGIREDEGDGDNDSRTIKLHKSIYS